MSGMWTQTLLDRYEAGWALPNAIREALPTAADERIGAGADLLMAALSMPDAGGQANGEPSRIGPDSIQIGDFLLNVRESAEPESLAIHLIPLQPQATIPATVWDLPNFVGQTMMLRAWGGDTPIASWLRSSLL